jgi:hypothetical protein
MDNSLVRCCLTDDRYSVDKLSCENLHKTLMVTILFSSILAKINASYVGRALLIIKHFFLSFFLHPPKVKRVSYPFHTIHHFCFFSYLIDKRTQIELRTWNVEKWIKSVPHYIIMRQELTTHRHGGKRLSVYWSIPINTQSSHSLDSNNLTSYYYYY